jgi:hypothetical protein
MRGRRTFCWPALAVVGLTAGVFSATVMPKAVGSASSKIPTAASRPALSAVSLDGLAAEWPPGDRVRDEKSGGQFAFLNDGRNFYVLLVLENSSARKSLEGTGMTILFRPAGTKKPWTGVLFFTRNVSAEAYIGWQESRGAVLTDGEKAELRKTATHAVFLAFAVGDKGSMYGPLLRQSDLDPPDFRAVEGATETTCEFRMPLAPPGEVPGGIGAVPGEIVRVSFNWGGIQRKTLATPSSREAPSSQSGYVSGTGRTWGQEFLDTFDAMSRPTTGTEKYAFSVDVTLAGKNQPLTRSGRR